MIIRFVIDGEPTAKGRPRAVRRGKGIAMVTPGKTAAYESLVRIAAGPSMPRERLAGPLSVTIVAVFKRPKRLMRKSDPHGPIRHTVKPDADNVAKAVLDGLAPWFDDKQVADLSVSKRYAARDDVPHVAVTVCSS